MIIRGDTEQPIDENINIYTTMQNTKNKTCMAIIKNLWQQLDKQEDNSKIVVLLKAFDNFLPKIFSEVVNNQLCSTESQAKVKAITRFNIFWKLTSKDYPTYIPFKEQDDKENRCYIALHTMINILENFDPTLRLTCKSWLNDCQENFRRILDPLIEEFLDNSNVFVSLFGQIFFQDDYDTQVIIYNFGKLRNIILNTQEKMIYYMKQTEATEYVREKFNNVFGYLNLEKQKLNYLQIIVYITLQFIMGQAVESVNDKLFQES